MTLRKRHFGYWGIGKLDIIWDLEFGYWDLNKRGSHRLVA